jgi:hypothetical protein
MPPIYDAIKELLIERGWDIVPANENKHGEVREFMHPQYAKVLPVAWLDAIILEHDNESVFLVSTEGR